MMTMYRRLTNQFYKDEEIGEYPTTTLSPPPPPPFLRKKLADSLFLISFFTFYHLPSHNRSQTFPNTLSSNLDVPPSPNHSINSRGSPRHSPHGSPRHSPMHSPREQRRHTDLGSQLSLSGSDKEKSPIHQNWTKSQWRRKVIRKRQGSTARSNSVSSERSLSPSEKMVR